MAGKQSPPIETKTVSETRRTFSETLNRVYRGEARVVVEKSGIAVGAIVSPREFALLQRLEEERRVTLEAFAKAREGFVDIPEEELEREIESAITDVEDEHRRARDERAEKQSA